MRTEGTASSRTSASTSADRLLARSYDGRRRPEVFSPVVGWGEPRRLSEARRPRPQVTAEPLFG